MKKMKDGILTFILLLSSCSGFSWNCLCVWVNLGLPRYGWISAIPLVIGVLLHVLTVAMIYYSEDEKSEPKESNADELLQQMDRMLGMHFNGEINNRELYLRFFDLKKDYKEGK